MDEKDCSEHYDDDAGGANANQDAGENGDAAGDLGESDEVADDIGRVHVGSEAVGAGSTECAEQDGAAVVEDGERGGNAKEEQGEVHLGGGWSGGCGKCGHGVGLLGLLCSRIRAQRQTISWRSSVGGRGETLDWASFVPPGGFETQGTRDDEWGKKKDKACRSPRRRIGTQKTRKTGATSLKYKDNSKEPARCRRYKGRQRYARAKFGSAFSVASAKSALR